MQLKLSVAAAALLLASTLPAEDYISVQYMYYDEASGRTSVSTPVIEINKDFGADHTLNFTFTHDTVSGASPTWYDSASGASSTIPDGTVNPGDLAYDYLPYSDRRQAYGLRYTTRFASRDQLDIGGNFSDEKDYTSREISAEYLHYLDPGKNRSVSLGVSYQNNTVTAFCEKNGWLCDTQSGASPKATSERLEVYNVQLGAVQILDSTSLVKLSAFAIIENGYLSNPYMNVVRYYDTGNPILTPERKPGSRNAYGATLSYSKAFTAAATFNGSYRFYDDDWDIRSHTLNGELYLEQTSRLTLAFGLRYYTQSAAAFYHAGKDHFTDEKHASSDRRMDRFDAMDYRFGFTYSLYDTLIFNANADYYIQYGHFDAMYYNAGFKYLF